MIEILPSAPNVLALRLCGRVTAEDYEQVIAAIEPMLQSQQRIGVFADLTGFTDIMPDAAAKDFGYALGKISQWTRFKREAVVTDKEWVRALMRLAAPFAPFMELRVFSPGQEAEALAWAADV